MSVASGRVSEWAAREGQGEAAVCGSPLADPRCCSSWPDNTGSARISTAAAHCSSTRLHTASPAQPPANADMASSYDRAITVFSPGKRTMTTSREGREREGAGGAVDQRRLKICSRCTPIANCTQHAHTQSQHTSHADRVLDWIVMRRCCLRVTVCAWTLGRRRCLCRCSALPRPRPSVITTRIVRTCRWAPLPGTHMHQPFP